MLKENSLKYAGTAGERAVNERGRTFIMPADHVTVAAEFVPVPASDDYTVSAGNTLHGRIIPEPGYAKAKDPVYLHVIPDPGYFLVPNSLKIKGPSVDQQVDEKTRTFEVPAEHVIVSAEFTALPSGQYTVRTDMIENGRITVAPAYGGEGTFISLQLHPDFEYRLKADTLHYITASGQSVPIDEVARAFSLPADHVTVRAEFEKLPPGNYMVFSEITVNGHIIPAPESGPRDTEIFLWVIPDAGYQYKAGTLDFKIDKNSPPASISDADRTFKLPGSHVLVDAEFEPAASGKYTVRINPADHGRIYVNPEAAAAGETVTLDIRPNPKYGLKKGSLKYTGDDGLATPIPGSTFSMPGKHITIYGEFESVERLVQIDKKLSGGQISAKPEKAYPGEIVSLTVRPANGNKYEAGSLKYLDSGGGKTDVDEKTLQFAMPNDDVSLTAQFKPFTAMENLAINNKTPVTLAAGKTDYTFWLPGQDAEAVFTFDIAANAKAEPQSGEKHALQVFENPPVQYTVKDPDGITETTYTFRIIRELVPTKPVPQGSFLLDSKKGPTMEITKPFRIGTYEVTQEEWKRVMGSVRGSEGNNYPARGVNWYEAVVFCNKLSMLEQKTPVYSLNNQTDPALWGAIPRNSADPRWTVKAGWEANGYRLPTEMEWLWAAMGAANGQSGTNAQGANYIFAGYPLTKNMDEAVWYQKNSEYVYHPVGKKLANALGLYDMSGNAAEWCWDWYDKGLKYEKITTGSKDYTGPASGSWRIVRGGSIECGAWLIFLSLRGDPQAAPSHQPPYSGPADTGLRIFCRD
jgi:formylglycine-generating enzyme required for sulfatase activity